MLILSNYVILAFINKIYKYCHAWMIYRSVCEVSILGAWALDLSLSESRLSDFVTCSTCFIIWSKGTIAQLWNIVGDKI